MSPTPRFVRPYPRTACPPAHPPRIPTIGTAMVAIRHERLSDVPAREALLDRRVRRGPLRQDLRAAARRPPAGGRPRPDRDRRRARRRHGAAVARLDRLRPAGAPPRPARRRSRLPQPRHRRGADEPRHRGGAPARPSDHPPRRRRALLREVRLLRGRDREPLAPGAVRAAPAARPRAAGRIARRRARRGPRPRHRPGGAAGRRWNGASPVRRRKAGLSHAA